MTVGCGMDERVREGQVEDVHEMTTQMKQCGVRLLAPDPGLHPYLQYAWSEGMWR